MFFLLAEGTLVLHLPLPMTLLRLKVAYDLIQELRSALGAGGGKGTLRIDRANILYLLVILSWSTVLNNYQKNVRTKPSSIHLTRRS
jgi:hypothetical protein